MRLVSAFLFVALTGSWALANDAKPANPKPEVTKRKVPYRVVKTLPETGQVLLFDRIHATHVVAEVGQSLDGYLVEDIDEEEVTLLADGGTQVILTAPPPPRTARRTANKALAPADPYGAANAYDDASPNGEAGNLDGAGAASGPVPVDPYAEPEPPSVPGEGGVRVATAPHAKRSMAAETAAPIVDSGAPDLSDPYGDPGIAAFADAVGATSTPAPAARPGMPAKPAKADPKPHTAGDDAASALAAAATGTSAPPASTSSGTTAPDSGASAAGAPASGASASDASASASSTATASAATATIARAELDAALADFGRLASSFRATFTPDGVRFDRIQDGTLLTRIGLRKGDIVTYVDGQPLRSLDDAANLYARAGAVRSTTVQVVRGGKLVTLRVAIQ